MTENIKNDFLVNLELVDVDVVERCKKKSVQPDSTIVRRGKNWYIVVDGCEITVNAHSFTIITVHKIRK